MNDTHGQKTVPSATKFTSLKNLLQAKIINGEFRPGQLFLSDNTLAAEYAVSHVTASKVISALMHEGLVERIQGKGTFVKPPSSRRGAEMTHPPAAVPPGTRIGVAAFLQMEHPEVQTSGAARILAPFERLVNEAGARIELFNCHPDRSLTPAFLERIRSANVAALLFIPPTPSNPRMESTKLALNDIPVIVTECPDCGRDTVYFDQRNVALTATQRLIELGHHSLGFMMLETDASWQADRLEGFTTALRKAGLHLTPPGIYGVGPIPSAESIRTRIRQMAPEVKTRHTAMVCSGDIIAALLIGELRSLGVEVPRDFSVVGMDDDPHYRHCDITTVQTSRQELGVSAYKLLAELMTTPGGGEPRRIAVPCPLIIRKTDGPAPRRP